VQKNFELITFASSSRLAESVARLWLETVQKSRRENSPHSVAFSGGRIATEFFLKTALQAVSKDISLAHVDFFWADERCVPPSDPESNFSLANYLLTSQKIPADRIHRLCGELNPVEAVAQANQEINEAIPVRKNGQPVLDIVFLGVGPDGHVASLFPNASDDVLHCKSPFLFIENSPKPPPRRITLSYAAIAAAKEVWILASGDGKERVVSESISYRNQTPLARVLQSRNNTRIFTDFPVTQRERI
jgi:6-phosphogluconolactonase